MSSPGNPLRGIRPGGSEPYDDITDTYWYRADMDYFLVKEAQRP